MKDDLGYCWADLKKAKQHLKESRIVNDKG